jgi:hypothetical protein
MTEYNKPIHLMTSAEIRNELYYNLQSHTLTAKEINLLQAELRQRMRDLHNTIYEQHLRAKQCE